MTGLPSSCGIDIPDPSRPTPSTVAITPLDHTPYSDGIYPFTYTPTVAGSYVLDIQLLTRGGLLATYYKGANLTYPVLASRGNFHDPSLYHTPYWCDGLEVGNWSSSWTFLNPLAGHIPFCDMTLAGQGCGCDSTRLDKTLSFVWGDQSPLPYDDLYSGDLPPLYSPSTPPPPHTDKHTHNHTHTHPVYCRPPSLQANSQWTTTVCSGVGSWSPPRAGTTPSRSPPTTV